MAYGFFLLTYLNHIVTVIEVAKSVVLVQTIEN
jgi:hypothetical protein